MERDKAKYLFMEYIGNDGIRFVHLCKHILDNDYDYKYYLYQGGKEHGVQVYIDVAMLEIDKAEYILTHISSKLQKLLPKEWRCLPVSSLPREYNIATLPYAII